MSDLTRDQRQDMIEMLNKKASNLLIRYEKKDILFEKIVSEILQIHVSITRLSLDSQDDVFNVLDEILNTVRSINK